MAVQREHRDEATPRVIGGSTRLGENLQRARWIPAGAALLALLVGVIDIARPSYWFDEAASISVATRSLPEQLRVAERIDAVHALYNALLSGWVALLGIGEFATRSLSLLVFAAAAAGFALFLLRIRGVRTAIAGVALFVLLPGIAWAGGEARGYACSLAGAVWSLVLIEALLSRRGALTRRGVRVAGWLGYALVVMATLGFSLLAALMVFGHVLLVRYLDRRALGVWFASWVLAVAAVTPLLLRAAGQTGQVAWIDHGLVSLAAKVALGQVFWGPRFNDGISAAMISAIVLALLSVVLGATAVVRAIRGSRDPELEQGTDRTVSLTSTQATWFGLVLFAVPTVLLAGATAAGLHLYTERYPLFAAPGICILIAEGLVSLRRRPMVAAAILLVIACLPQLIAAKGENAKSGEDYRGLARAAATADQLVYAHPASRGVQIAYPHDVFGSDLLLDKSALSSGTLWGVNAPAEVLRDRVERGRIAVLGLSPEQLAKTEQVLGELGCTQQGEALVTNRFLLENYVCAGDTGGLGDGSGKDTTHG